MNCLFYGYSDPQELEASTCCDLCGSEIFEEDTVYLIDDTPICEECLGIFAAEYFAPYRMMARYLPGYCSPERV